MNKEIIRFTASWCGPCKVLGPQYEKMSSEYQGTEIHWTTVDIDTAPETAQSFSIRSVPSVVFVNDGVVINTVVGLQPQHIYEEAVRELENA